MRVLRIFAPPVFLRRLAARAGEVPLTTAARVCNLAVIGLWAVKAFFAIPAFSYALPAPTVLLEASVLACVELGAVFAALNLLGWLATSPGVLRVL